MTSPSRRDFLLIAAGSLAAAVGCSSDDDVELPQRRLRIATGNAGGVYVAYGEGIAAAIRERLPQLRAEVVATGASVENLRMLADGRADVAFSLADAAADAVRGDAALELAALGRLYENYVQVLVLADTPFVTVDDLAGQRVATGSAGSGTSLVAHRILETAGLRAGRDVSTLDLDLQTSAAELAAGRIAAFFWSGGLPASAVQQLVDTTEVRLLDLAGVAADLADAYADVYVAATVPASVYGFDEPVTTVSAANYLVVRADEDAELAYQLTRLLFTAQDRITDGHPEARRLNLRSAISTYPLELHPGAERYYREAKD